MGFESVLVEVDDQVATVTLNRPEHRNAWTLTMAAELGEAMADCDADDHIRAVVVTGAGRDFSVGADLRAGTIGAPGADSFEARERPHLFPHQLRKPVIAALNGHAVGAGSTFPLLCDIRVVAEEAKFGFPFVRRGVMAEMGGHWTLPRLAGLAVAADLLMTGRLISGREAVELGICSRALPAAEVVGEALRIAHDIVIGVAPASAAATKRMLWDALSLSFTDSLAQEREMFSELASQPDAREGVDSFLERRHPIWSGSPNAVGRTPRP